MSAITITPGIAKFLDDFEKVAPQRKWEVFHRTIRTAEDDIYPCCPMAACCNYNNNCAFDIFAQKLDLTNAEVDAIARAADRPPNSNPAHNAIRARLLAACGLTENQP